MAKDRSYRYGWHPDRPHDGVRSPAPGDDVDAPDDESTLMTTHAAAELIGCEPDHISTAARAGLIPAWKIRGRWRCDRTEIERLAELAVGLRRRYGTAPDRPVRLVPQGRVRRSPDGSPEPGTGLHLMIYVSLPAEGRVIGGLFYSDADLERAKVEGFDAVRSEKLAQRDRQRSWKRAERAARYAAVNDVKRQPPTRL